MAVSENGMAEPIVEFGKSLSKTWNSLKLPLLPSKKAESNPNMVVLRLFLFPSYILILTLPTDTTFEETAPLTHLTKARAKGPPKKKRRPPKNPVVVAGDPFQYSAGVAT